MAKVKPGVNEHGGIVKSAIASFPSATQNGKVTGQGRGMLCKANGVVQPPATFHKVIAAFIKTTDAGVTLTSADVAGSTTNSPQPPVIKTPSSSIQPGDSFSWSVIANANLQANVGANNKIWVTAQYLNMQTNQPFLEPEPYSSPFTADSVMMCPMPIAEVIPDEEVDEVGFTPLSSVALDLTAPTPSHAYRDLSHHASNCQRPCHDWLNFDGLSVDNPFGNWLHVDTMPLKARTIAVAAKKVCWRANPRSQQIIRRPAGSVLDFNDRPRYPFPGLDGFLFSQLPPYSIVIYQPGAGLVHVVLSQCTEHPDIVSLDPHDHVLVYVNDRPFNYDDNLGTFSLSVAILDGSSSVGCFCH